jgi:hypothetical protein
LSAVAMIPCRGVKGNYVWLFASIGIFFGLQTCIIVDVI